MNRILRKRFPRQIKADFFRLGSLFLIIALCMYSVIALVDAAEIVISGTAKNQTATSLEDGQFTATCIDQSPAAKAEYAEFLKEGGHAATNYSFFAMQTGFRAQEEFAREFKRLMGKKCVAIMWCESPFKGRRASGAESCSSNSSPSS